MAKTTAKDLLRVLREFEKTPESVGVDLRLDLADLVMKHLDRLGWTQKRLAKQADMQESFISRIINAESNCTFEVAGRIVHALGVQIGIQELPPARAGVIPAQASTAAPIVMSAKQTELRQETIHGKETRCVEGYKFSQASTGEKDPRIAGSAESGTLQRLG